MGHPAGGVGKLGPRHLAALLMVAATLLLERFGYYGMRGVLVLHLMRDAAVEPDAARAAVDLLTKAVAYGPVAGALLAIVVPRQVLLPAGLVLCTVGIAASATSAAVVVYGGLALVAFGLWLYKAALFAFAAELLPGAGEALRGAVFAGLYAALNLSALLSNLMIGGVASSFGVAVGLLAAAAATGLAALFSTAAAVVAPPPAGPRPPLDGRPLLGALVVIALAMPATALLQVLGDLQWKRASAAFEGVKGAEAAWFFSINPLVVIAGAVLLAGSLLALHAARVRVTTAQLLAAGSLGFVLAAAPFLREGPVEMRAVYASVALAAVAEVVFFVALLSRLASAGHPGLGALAIALQSASAGLGAALASSGWLAPPAPFQALLVLTLAAAGALWLLGPPLQRALFRDGDEAPRTPPS